MMRNSECFVATRSKSIIFFFLLLSFAECNYGNKSRIKCRKTLNFLSALGQKASKYFNFQPKFPSTLMVMPNAALSNTPFFYVIFTGAKRPKIILMTKLSFDQKSKNVNVINRQCDQ